MFSKLSERIRGLHRQDNRLSECKVVRICYQLLNSTPAEG